MSSVEVYECTHVSCGTLRLLDFFLFKVGCLLVLSLSPRWYPTERRGRRGCCVVSNILTSTELVYSDVYAAFSITYANRSVAR